MTALIIDDNEIDRFINQKLLEMYGFAFIRCVKNAKEALQYLEDTDTKCQFILTDINLPLMDGFEFSDNFIELGLDKKHGEIILLSASLNPFDKEKARQRNIRFIEKPLSIEKLFLTSKTTD